jgi:tRNA (uracil-5-)-methyltransferase TRM9
LAIFFVFTSRSSDLSSRPGLIQIDRSENLARIALQHQPHSTVVADIMDLPHRDAFFDFAISIAVVHHISTPVRRVQAIAEILRTVKRGSETQSGGKMLIYAWALEQKNSRRGWDKGDPQDIMVPWIRKAKSPDDEPQTFNRYYHLYEEGELERDIDRAGGHVLESGYEKDNWWVIATPKTAS